MKLGVVGERRHGETRVALSPESAGKFRALGMEVLVEAGAGERALFLDDDYEAAGAAIVHDPQQILAAADMVLKARAPLEGELRTMKKDSFLVGMLEPLDTDADVPSPQDYADAGIAAFALELVPRITRAQSMDVLSSQANLAGYRAVLEAGARYPRMFPMMMTAAGAIAPARVFVMGTGVAGLQAIATARRLGAIVSATDVRAATKEQVESLGASFLMVEENPGDSESAAGYAKETSEAYRQAQAKMVGEHIARQDIVITAALIPGRPAPRLISRAMLHGMRAGSVVVDLAVEQGGNCEGSRAGEAVVEKGVTILGWRNMAGRLPADASALYARNLFSFAGLLLGKEDNGRACLAPDWEDEILQATLLARNGAVTHPAFQDQTEQGET